MSMLTVKESCLTSKYSHLIEFILVPFLIYSFISLFTFYFSAFVKQRRGVVNEEVKQRYRSQRNPQTGNPGAEGDVALHDRPSVRDESPSMFENDVENPMTRS